MLILIIETVEDSMNTMSSLEDLNEHKSMIVHNDEKQRDISSCTRQLCTIDSLTIFAWQNTIYMCGKTIERLWTQSYMD